MGEETVFEHYLAYYVTYYLMHNFSFNKRRYCIYSADLTQQVPQLVLEFQVHALTLREGSIHF